MEQGIKSEVRQEIMREFGNVRNEVSQMNQTLVNHCLDCLKVHSGQIGARMMSF